MKAAAPLRLVVLLLCLLGVSCRTLSPSGEPPSYYGRLFKSADSVVLYSLNPRRSRDAVDETLHGYKILGQTPLDKEQSRQVAEELYRAQKASDGSSVRCFVPRHAVRTVAAGHIHDFLICYQCYQVYWFQDGTQVATVTVEGSPRFLNKLLQDAGIPLSNKGPG
ncbi:hypothetical protein [Verrucomicrobium sp. BvORR034]|uniref:hypothetical protein n=1 Tax=Verrucomicrobium sp. BvORR034 TaxID=1396418 RepID=UPI002240EE22|nr:hypothetical protein [Verrucomicrobium sp. BvORR034]